jgi:hypothetical protein
MNAMIGFRCFRMGSHTAETGILHVPKKPRHVTMVAI